MKTKIVLMSALLALLATGCGKDKFGRVSIFAENMTAAGNTKLLVDPSNMSTKWLENETINVNGTSFAILRNGSEYQVDASSLGDATTLWAIYPGANFGGNEVTVANNNGSAGTITLNKLMVNMHSDGKHDVVFPMAGKAVQGDDEMTFRHLTAGFRFNISSASPVTVNTFKVYVYGSANAQSVSANSVNYTVKWANEGTLPTTPIGGIGNIADRSEAYGSEMVFGMQTEGVDGVEFNSTPKSFTVPVCLCGNVKRITVVGLDDSDNQLFAKTINFGTTGISMVKNTIYPVRAIEL